MNDESPKEDKEPGGLARLGLYLTRQERYILLAILAIALIGLFARYWHLTHTP